MNLGLILRSPNTQTAQRWGGHHHLVIGGPVKLNGCSLVTRVARGAVVGWATPASRLAADVLMSSIEALEESKIEISFNRSQNANSNHYFLI